MAQNNKLKPVFSSTSSEEDEGETSGSESEEDSGEKQNHEPKKALIPPPIQSANKPQAPDLSSSETEESGSGSDSGTDSDTDLPPKNSSVVDRNVKPIASKPMERTVGNNVESKRSLTTPPAKSKQPPPTPTKANPKANTEPKNTIAEPLQSANEFKTADLSSSETEESCSDTESDSDSDSPAKKPTVADPKAKPVASKPMERTAGAKVESKRISTPPPVKNKRPLSSPAANEKNAKKAKQTTVNAPSGSSNKPQAPDLSSSETEESDSDSDLPPKKSTVAAPNIKPISTKPMEREGSNLESKSAKKDGSKTIPMAKSKQPVPAKKNTAADDDSKKQLFQRLWSEDDEIVILQGMIDYIAEKNGENPIADMGEFHEFIKKSLHVDVSRGQLVDKVRRLKKKYLNNAEKEKDGKERSFSKSHEQKGYELSKLIWGGNSDNSGTMSKKNQSQKNGNSKGTAAASLVKSNGVDDNQTSMMEVDKNLDISRFVQYGGKNDSLILPEEISKAALELVKDSKRAELEEKWKKLKKQELMLYVNRLELLKEQALVVLEAIDSSGN